MNTPVHNPTGTFLGHPRGLFLLFGTEMWERFSYYGMRALLVLYVVAATSAQNPGLGWAEPQALKLYAWYTAFVYLTPLIGGWLADNYLGQRKSVIIGGLLMALGQFSLAASPSLLGMAGPVDLGPLGHRLPGHAGDLLPRPDTPDPGQRLLQGEHLDHGRRPVRAGRRAP